MTRLTAFLLLLISVAPGVSKAQHDRCSSDPGELFLFVHSIIMLEKARFTSGEGMD